MIKKVVIAVVSHDIEAFFDFSKGLDITDWSMKDKIETPTADYFFISPQSNKCKSRSHNGVIYLPGWSAGLSSEEIEEFLVCFLPTVTYG